MKKKFDICSYFHQYDHLQRRTGRLSSDKYGEWLRLDNNIIVSCICFLCHYRHFEWYFISLVGRIIDFEMKSLAEIGRLVGSDLIGGEIRWIVTRRNSWIGKIAEIELLKRCLPATCSCFTFFFSRTTFWETIKSSNI